MKNKGNFVLLALALILAFALTALASDATFTGSISDSMCGLKHNMKGLSDKECTVTCVKGGAKYILADNAHKKVYDLDNQAEPAKFAGDNVVVKGSLNKDGKTIHVASIEAAKK